MFYNLQKTYEFDGGYALDEEFASPFHVIQQVSREKLYGIEKDLAIIAPVKNEKLRLLETLLSGIPDAVLAERTGLNGPALKRARDRWFTETLITPLSPEHAASIEAALKPHGWALSRGGRFYSVQSAQANKGEAMRWLGRQFEKNTGIMPKIAAIGDSPNDFPMLSAADKAFLVQRNDGSWASVQLHHLARVANIGPLGFSDAVRQIIPRSA